MSRRTRHAPALAIALDPAAPDGLHGQIREQIRRAILERRLAPGTTLPSSRLLAAELGCARGTVLTATDQLVAEGYLVARPASGLSVAADLPDEMLVAPHAPDAPADAPRPQVVLPRRARDMLRDAPAPAAAPVAFPIGQPDRTAFPFALWAKLLEREWRRPAWCVAGAPHPFGHPDLRRAIAEHLHAARGFACDPRSVVVTSGVRQSVSLMARVALEAGDAAWVEEPGYPGMAEALAAAGVRPVPVAIDEAGFSPERAWAEAPEARMAVVAPSHHFPTGIVLALQRRLALLGWAERQSGWIVEDDFDGEYRYAGRPLAPLRALDRGGRVAYLGSFSKLLFPALRLSFLVLPDALAEAAEAILPRVSVPASLLGQGALARFIADGHFTSHLRRTRLLYAARQECLLAAARRHLDGLLELAPDAGGMHLVATPSRAENFDDRAATAAAAARGVQVAPLSASYAGPARRLGLLLGYAGTPEDDIEPATIRLAASLAASS
jgi:GntR family transcriptional regulator/MocR family aminotransferase